MAPPSQAPGAKGASQQDVHGNRDQQPPRALVSNKTGAVMNEDNPLAVANEVIDLTESEETMDTPAPFQGKLVQLESDRSYLFTSYSGVFFEPPHDNDTFVPPIPQPALQGHKRDIAFLPAPVQYSSGELYLNNARGWHPARPFPPTAVGHGAISDQDTPRGHWPTASQGVHQHHPITGIEASGNTSGIDFRVVSGARDIRGAASRANVAESNHCQQPSRAADYSGVQPGSEEAWKWYQENFGDISDLRAPEQQVDEFPAYNEPIDRSVTLDGICRDYPNHLNNHDVLDALIQYFYTDADVWNRLREDFTTALSKKIEKISKQTKNVMMRRFQRRWGKLGSEKLRLLIEGPKIRVSEPGVGGGPYYGRSEPGRSCIPPVSFNPRASKRMLPKPKEPTRKDGKGVNTAGKVNTPQYPTTSTSAEQNNRSAAVPYGQEGRLVYPSSRLDGTMPVQESVVDLGDLLAHEFFPIPVENAPRGLFCDLPFWSFGNEYEEFEMSFRGQMETAVDLARVVLDADLALSHAGVAAKLGKLAELMSWPLAIRREVVEQWKPGTVPQQLVRSAFPKLLSFFVKEAVYTYLMDSNEYNPKATAASCNGGRLITSLCTAAVSGTHIKMQDIIYDLQEKCNAVRAVGNKAERSRAQRL